MKVNSPQESKEIFDKHYDGPAPLIRTIYNWFKKFPEDQMNTSDVERSGPFTKATTTEVLVFEFG